jgi:GNAT superfamily N-acetyltransferase
MFTGFLDLVTEKDIKGTMDFYFPEVRCKIEEYNDYIILVFLVVQLKRRGKGEGVAFMEKLISVADKNKKDIYLDPTNDFDSNYDRLVKFYERFGFVEKTDDIKHKMVRRHK